MDSGDLRRLGVNTLALYASRAAIILVPLIIIPYLARVLQPDALAIMFIGQALGMWSTMVVEYGFQLSATRDIAHHRDDAERVADIVAGVVGAKGVLVVGTAALVLVVTLAVPALRADPILGVLAWLIGIGSGTMPRWYFLGQERMKFLSALDIISRLTVLALIVALVDGPEDVWIVLAIFAAAPIVASILAYAKLYREINWRLPNLRSAISSLRSGAGMFLYVTSDSLFMTANVFLLGIFAPLPQVSFYATAEKFGTAALGFLDPILEAVYPFQSKLMGQDRKQATKVVRVALLVVGGGALFGAILMAILAPWIIALLLGPGYEGAVPILRILAILLPLAAVGNVLGYHWMLPMGLDRPFLTVLISAGVINVILVSIVAGPFGAMGVAVTAVFVEVLIIIGLFVVLERRRLNPLSSRIAPE